MPSIGLLVIGLWISLFNNQSDSLFQEFENSKDDTTRVDILESLWRVNLGTDIDTAIYYAKEAVQYAIDAKDPIREAYMLKNVGIGYYYKSDFSQTLDYWHASLDLFTANEYPKGISNLLSNLGGVYNSTGDYDTSIEYHLKTIRIAETIGDELRKGTALQNIGAVYSNMSDMISSKEYYEDALEIFRGLSYEKGIGIVVMNLAEVYKNSGAYEQALLMASEAQEIFKNANDPSLPEAKIVEADIYRLQSNTLKAIQTSQEAYELAKTYNSKAFMQRSLVVMGNSYNERRLYERAKSAFSEAISYRQDIGINIDLQQAYLGLAQSLKAINNYKELSQIQDSIISTNKQIYDIDQNNQIANLQLEFNLDKREAELELKSQQFETARQRSRFFIALSSLLMALIGGLIYLYRYSQKKNDIISQERNKSDELLRNILPPATAEELKKYGSVKPQKHPFVSVLFTDFVDFTQKAEASSHDDLVQSINYYFEKFDEIVLEHKLEKIKTIGDAYMCAGGLDGPPDDRADVIHQTLLTAQEMLNFVTITHDDPPIDIIPFDLRVGIHCGPVVAGVVGRSKFQYDIWGDTVNVASRMESLSENNRINVSKDVYDISQDMIEYEYRGTVNVKSKGDMEMYFYKPK